MIVKFSTIRLIIILILLSINLPYTSAQVKNKGIPFIKNFKKRDYNASTQNWAILQDKRGVMYFGNSYGLLEYDGLKWKSYTLPNSSVIRTIGTDDYGRIYVGAFDEFGYFKADRQGKLIYHSMIHLVPDKYKGFANIWKIFNTRWGIIFQSYVSVFFYKNDSLRVIPADREFNFSFYVQGQYYIQDKEKGLLQLNEEGNEFQIVKGGEIFKDKRIWSVLSYDQNKNVVATVKNGLYILDIEGVKKWNTQAEDFLSGNQIFCGTNIGNDFFAYGTITGGIVIIDKLGRVIQNLDKHNGLQNNTVLSSNTDREGNLWVGLDNGIDLIELSSPLSIINNKEGIGTGYCSIFYEGKLYLGTNQGLYYQEWNEYSNPFDNKDLIKFVNNTTGQVWSLTLINNHLVCGHDKGTFIIKGNTAEKINSIDGAWSFLKYENKPGYIIGGCYTGLLLYRLNERGNLLLVKAIKGTNESCRIMEIDKEGYIWMSHTYKGIYRFRLNSNLDSIEETRFYQTQQGLPTNYNIYICKIKNEIIFASDSGVYRYIKSIDHFEKHSDLNRLLGTENTSNWLQEDRQGNIWFINKGELGMMKLNNNGAYQSEKLPFCKIKRKFFFSFENIYKLDNNNILFGTEDGYIHYDPRITKDYFTPFNVLIREVRTIGANDSLIYGGNVFIHDENQGEKKKPMKVKLPYFNNSIRFTFSAIFNENSEKIEYQFLLEGYEKEWSQWSTEASKEFTDMDEGNYVFKVKARNMYHVESQEAQFAFIILPPWYRTIWAYIFYFVIAVLLVISAYYFIERKIEKEKQVIKLKKENELKTQHEEFTKEAIISEQEIIKLRNENLNMEIEKKKAEMMLKNQELASFAMQLTHKNEMLSQIKKKLQLVSENSNDTTRREVNKLVKTIEEDIFKADDWKKFEMHFDQIHADFLKRIKEQYHQLTPTDLKLCAYLRMNLSSKEVASLLNISVRGVEISRYRLRKKLNIDSETNLVEFMMKV